jgi:hypothetical protein
MLKSVKYLDARDMIRSANGEAGGDVEEAMTPLAESPVVQASAGPDGLLHGQLEGVSAPPEASSNHDDHDHNDTASLAGGSSVHDPHPPGQKIHMRLLSRPQMTTLALPSSPTWPSDAVPPHTAPYYFLPDVQAYSRFMLATPEYMLAELEREMGELQRE